MTHLRRESRSATDRFLARLREVARECGYAVGVHGSETRDLDLIAAPWTVEAVSAQDLVDTLCERVPLAAQPVVPPMAANPEMKPWGRLAWSLAGCPDHKYVDLSVAPRAGESVPLPTRRFLDAVVLAKGTNHGEGVDE